jgi:MEDS: MEthanogen/methylotroph, DcmR Sensory domain
LESPIFGGIKQLGEQRGKLVPMKSLDGLRAESISLRSGGPLPTDHFVELYADDESLVESVRTFMSIGLNQDEAAIIVADRAHRDAFEEALRASVDIDAARAKDLYTSLDAAETLALFMEDGMPVATRFQRVVGDLIRRASADGRKVRVFGEMVAILWEQGNVAAALSLEDIWNDFAATHPFQLFCAYPATSFGEKNQSPLTAVCERHSHVLLPR